mmetsp:Transcript_20331/g.57212  ORF Transcript_20331/g.57212 Transcript_20331/m.57212 type:complete len:108 (-) Transcript_20331:20-343(-)
MTGAITTGLWVELDAARHFGEDVFRFFYFNFTPDLINNGLHNVVWAEVAEGSPERCFSTSSVFKVPALNRFVRAPREALKMLPRKTARPAVALQAARLQTVHGGGGL